MFPAMVLKTCLDLLRNSFAPRIGKARIRLGLTHRS